MPTSQNGSPLPSCHRDDRDLPGTINSIAAASGSVYLATRSVITAVIIAVVAALLVIADLTRQR
jgi:hypothetical protein